MAFHLADVIIRQLGKHLLQNEGLHTLPHLIVMDHRSKIIALDEEAHIRDLPQSALPFHAQKGFPDRGIANADLFCKTADAQVCAAFHRCDLFFQSLICFFAQSDFGHIIYLIAPKFQVDFIYNYTETDEFFKAYLEGP